MNPSKKKKRERKNQMKHTRFEIVPTPRAVVTRTPEANASK
jgi:hypothetical protein